jgi:hypothetical protein
LRRRRRRVVARTVTSVTVLAILSFVVFSPLILRIIANIPNFNWGKLSSIGQTYGAVSAILAALALIGVSASVLLQLRETRFNRLEAGRARHYELIRLAMENPAYFNIFASSAWPPDSGIETQRSIAYINLYLQFQQMLWEFSDISETDVQSTARDLFRTSLGREYWQRYGSVRLLNDNTRREREFDQTLDLIYKQEIASGPPERIAPSLEPLLMRERKFDRKKFAAGLTVTFVSVIAFGWLTRLARTLKKHLGDVDHTR